MTFKNITWKVIEISFGVFPKEGDEPHPRFLQKVRKCAKPNEYSFYFSVKQENEAKRTASKTANSTNVLDSSTTGDTNSHAGNVPIMKSRTENVHERIGFNPMPRNT